MTGSIAWHEARERVLTAYGAFSPELAEVGRRFFDRPWIDATLQPGKAGGAFAHPTVPSAHPYLLLNYHGRTRDVMTLAHELGHGVHQVLAARAGLPDGRHAADAGRDRERVRRDADVPRACWMPSRSEAPAHHAGGEGRGHAEHGGPPDRVLSLRDAAA